MKTKLIVFLLGTLFVINGSFGQSKGDFRPSLGIVFGTEAGIDEDGEKGQIGITPGIEYLITNSIGANVSYDYYFKSKVGGSGSDLSVQLGSLNIDGRYYFIPQIYGLVGVAFFKSKVHIPGFGNVSSNDTGLNLGAGAVFPLSDNLGVNAQLKYQSNIGQLAINGGVVFTF